MNTQVIETLDVVVIGGGPAGLSGALMLARSRRSVVVIDSGSPRNSPAEGVHGLLGHDGVPPAELLDRGRAEVSRYGGQVMQGTVTRATRQGDEFLVNLEDGTSLRARRLLVTTGVTDELPDVPGVAERWGRDVLHCPYCHGWEVRDKPIGVLASGPNSVHQALLFRQLSNDLTYFSHTLPPNDEEAREMMARDIRIVEGEVACLEIAADQISGVRMLDRSVIAREVMVVSTRMAARADFLGDLGLEAIEHPSGLGDYVKVDQTGSTDVPGVWAAGNVTDPAAQVGASAAAGAWAATRINADLVAAEARRAVEEDHPAPSS